MIHGKKCIFLLKSIIIKFIYDYKALLKLVLYTYYIFVTKIILKVNTHLMS